MCYTIVRNKIKQAESLKEKIELTNLVEVNNEQVVTTSIMVAESFGKRHDHVLRDIRNLEKDIPSMKMFFETKYSDRYGRKQTAFYMTKEGFLLLVSSYRGKDVLEKKIQILSNTDMISPSLPERKEIEFFMELKQSIEGFKEELNLYQQYSVLEYKVDGYIKELNLVIEYDEPYHMYTEKEDTIRQNQIEKALNCRFLRLSSENSNTKNIGLVFGEMFKIMKEDMCNE